MREGPTVELKIDREALVARPVLKKYTLDELMVQCDPSKPFTVNEVAWAFDGPVGLEEI